MRGGVHLEAKTDHDALERDYNGSVILDGKTGRPKMKDEYAQRGCIHSYATPEVDISKQLDRLPAHISDSLDRAQDRFGPRASVQSWEETLYAPLADGTAVTGTTESIMLPIFTLPANYLYPGRMLKWTVMGRVSTAITTPGVITLTLSYSAAGTGAVVMATSGGFIPDVTAAATNLTMMVEWWTHCRSVGTTGTGFTWGRIEMPDANDADITNFVIEYNKRMAPAATPAVATIDTTVARALSPTFDQSVGTGSFTAHVGFLEALT